MNNGNRSNKNSKKGFNSNKPKDGIFKKNTNKPTFYKGKPIFNKKPKQNTITSLDEDSIRLNKYIANSGICSRREADIYIVSGNVKVNGEVVDQLGYKVKPGDVVNFDGSLINPEKKVYVLLNKPKGFSTSEDTLSQENVLSLLKGATKSNLTPIGRMDKTTVGLLLFTNDTEMIQKFTSNNQRSSKMYQISLDRNLKYEDLERIEKGLTVNEHKVYVEEINYVDDQPKTEVGVKLKASSVKTVRNIFETLNYNVVKVDRVVFAGLTKFNLPRGKWRFLTDQEIINLKNS